MHPNKILTDFYNFYKLDAYKHVKYNVHIENIDNFLDKKYSIIYEKIQSRISRYEQKGYSVKYHNNNQTLSCIINDNINNYY